MAFNDQEIGTLTGQPVSLYEFVVGAQVWRFAASETDIVIAGDTVNPYKAAVIKDGGINLSGEAVSDDFSIEMQNGGVTAAFLSMYIGTPPSETVWVYFRRAHRHDLSAAPIQWVGSVSNVKRQRASAELQCTMLTTSFNRNGLRIAYMRTCPYALYDPATCKASRVGHSLTGAVTAKTGATITIASLVGATDGRFSGGYIEWTRTNGVIDRRAVELHVGASGMFHLLGFTDGLDVGMSVTAWDGCKRTPEECDTKFANLANYGGFPHLPGKSPFSGDPVF